MPPSAARAPRAPLSLLLVVAIAAMASHASAQCLNAPAGCKEPRPDSSPSTTYCLNAFVQDCSVAANTGCDPCLLWRDATRDCAAPTGDDVATCKKGFVIRKDKCATTDSKWKIFPSKKAYIGVETIKADPNGRKFNFLFKGLWDSALSGVNPCKTTLNWASNPSIAMMENSVEYRTQHTMHAHIGSATAEFRACVDAHVKAATKAKTWTPLLQCDFNNRGTVNKADTWVWLQGPVKTTASPRNVGSIVNKAFKGTGPAAALSDKENEWTGFGVTTATFNGKSYFAVMVYNYYASAVASSFKFQVGEYELIRGG